MIHECRTVHSIITCRSNRAELARIESVITANGATQMNYVTLTNIKPVISHGMQVSIFEVKLVWCYWQITLSNFKFILNTILH